MFYVIFVIVYVHLVVWVFTFFTIGSIVYSNMGECVCVQQTCFLGFLLRKLFAHGWNGIWVMGGRVKYVRVRLGIFGCFFLFLCCNGMGFFTGMILIWV